MATFTDKFIAQLEQRQHEFEAVFSDGVNSALEARLAERLIANWHPLEAEDPGFAPVAGNGTRAGSAQLPSPRSSPSAAGEEAFSQHSALSTQHSIFAIDGSEAARNFSNSAWLLIGQALLIGPNTEIPSLELRLVPGNVPGAVVDRYRSWLMRWLEVRLAVEHAGRFAGKTLIMDGSLYSTLPFLLDPLDGLTGQLGCGPDADLPLRILEAHLDLLELCRQQDILLLGVSKRTQERILTKTLLRLPDDLNVITPDMEDEPDELAGSRVPPDAEALERWTQAEPGYTTPLLLGLHSFGRRRETLLSAPEDIAAAFVPCSGYSPSRIQGIVERLRQAPAIAAFHVRFAPGDDCLRVDLPAYAIGRQDRIADLSSGLASAEPLEPIVRLLQRCYGGPNVYNAPLYAVDKQVRLSNEMVDGAFLSILRSFVGPQLRYNRSARRFL